MRKVVTGILALCMVSAIMAEPVLALPDTVKGDVNGDGVINTRDLTMMKKYLLGEDTEIDTDGADLNGDQKINVADMIYLTGILTEAVQPPQDPAEPKDPEPENSKEPKDPAEQKDPEEKNSDPALIAEMNKTAKNIFNTAVNAQTYLDYLHPGRKPASDMSVLKDADSSELTELIKLGLELPDGTRWKVFVMNSEIKGCICTSDGVTGAYPNEIPMSVSVDYDKLDDTHPEYYSEVTIDWKTVYPEGVSKDENIKDYVPKTTNELNQTAEMLYNIITTLNQEAETAGRTLLSGVADKYTGTVPDGIIDANYLEKIYRLANLSPKNTKFAVEMADGEIVGCICSDSYGKVSGAYPNTIPQTMNIPYTADNARPSGDIAFDWKQAFSEFISDDPVQSALPDYPEKSVSYYNSTAREVFTNAQTILQEKEAEGKEVKDGVYTETSELFDRITGQKVKYYVQVKNYEVVCCMVSGGDLTRSGAYPASIPQNMDIPFDEFREDKYPYNNADFKPDWKAIFPEYIKGDAEQPNQPVQSIAYFNSAAKKVFASVQTMLQEYETAGKEVPDGIYTSDSELFKELAADYKFTVKIKDYVVLGAAVGCEERSGAYPVSVPNLLNVPFDKMLSEITANYDTDWYELYPDAIMDFKTFSAEMGVDYTYTPLSYYWIKKAAVNSANANAKSVFITAQTVAQEFETNGVVVDGIFDSSNTSSEFAKTLKENLTWHEYDWSVKIENNVVVGACCSTTSAYGYTGAYPCYVPSECLVTYNGYNKLCEGNHKSDEWLSAGHLIMP
ncbi:MAG: hypothetical protein IJL67_07075 [Oscillospiraceae bacterium]|nr:hypothetical protein [Oscillospiraceae bacterium]